MDIIPSVPTIRLSDEFTLRQLLITDSVSLFPTFHDPENHKFTFYDPLSSIEQAERWIEKAIENPAWAIASHDDSAIGFVMYHPIEHEDSGCLLSYHLNKLFWGRGIVPSSVLLTDAYMFDTGLVKLAATVKPENTQSQRCIEKAGYHLEKTIDDYISSVINDHSRIRHYYVKYKP